MLAYYSALSLEHCPDIIRFKGMKLGWEGEDNEKLIYAAIAALLLAVYNYNKFDRFLYIYDNFHDSFGGNSKGIRKKECMPRNIKRGK